MGRILWPVTHVTHHSADPCTRMTRDPWPSPRPWHESITTTHESWWVHDYRLLLSAMMCNLEFWIWLSLFSEYFYNILHSRPQSSSLHSTRQFLQAEHSEQFFNLTFYTFIPHLINGSSVLRHWPVTHVTHSHLLTHLTHDPLTHCLLWWHDCTLLTVFKRRTSWGV